MQEHKNRKESPGKRTTQRSKKGGIFLQWKMEGVRKDNICWVCNVTVEQHYLLQTHQAFPKQSSLIQELWKTVFGEVCVRTVFLISCVWDINITSWPTSLCGIQWICTAYSSRLTGTWNNFINGPSSLLTTPWKLRQFLIFCMAIVVQKTFFIFTGFQIITKKF